MDLHSLSLQELKKVARDHKPKIKHYYVKSRLELIQLLSLKELPQEYIIEKMTIEELRVEAKTRGITKGIWKLSRPQFIDLLYPSSQQNNQDDDGGEKHDNPKKENT
jgi:hypothetical protein